LHNLIFLKNYKTVKISVKIKCKQRNILIFLKRGKSHKFFLQSQYFTISIKNVIHSAVKLPKYQTIGTLNFAKLKSSREIVKIRELEGNASKENFYCFPKCLILITWFEVYNAIITITKLRQHKKVSRKITQQCLQKGERRG
jgi:hypothetical protein